MYPFNTYFKTTGDRILTRQFILCAADHTSYKPTSNINYHYSATAECSPSSSGSITGEANISSSVASFFLQQSGSGFGEKQRMTLAKK